ncbi:hypothetical protein GCM10018954_003600 [Kutzneria kofuensis]
MYVAPASRICTVGDGLAPAQHREPATVCVPANGIVTGTATSRQVGAVEAGVSVAADRRTARAAAVSTGGV